MLSIYKLFSPPQNKREGQCSLFWCKVQGYDNSPYSQSIGIEMLKDWRYRNRRGHKSFTCAGFRARISGGLLYHRSDSEETPPISSSSFISSHVCAWVGTVGLRCSKERCRTQMKPVPVFPLPKHNMNIQPFWKLYKCINIRGFLCWMTTGFTTVQFLPAMNTRWRVGTNAGGDVGSNAGGDVGSNRRGATWGGWCWCCKPVLLKVSTWHSQLLHSKKNKNSLKKKSHKLPSAPLSV